MINPDETKTNPDKMEVDPDEVEIMIRKEDGAICNEHTDMHLATISEDPRQFVHVQIPPINRRSDLYDSDAYFAVGCQDAIDAIQAYQMGIDDIMQQFADEVFIQYKVEYEQKHSDDTFPIDRIITNLQDANNMLVYYCIGDNKIIFMNYFSKDGWGVMTFNEFENDIRNMINQNLITLDKLSCDTNFYTKVRAQDLKHDSIFDIY